MLVFLSDLELSATVKRRKITERVPLHQNEPYFLPEVIEHAKHFVNKNPGVLSVHIQSGSLAVTINTETFEVQENHKR